jgi:ribosome-binding factor A
MPGRRPERLAEQIREEVTRIIASDMHDPRIGFITVTQVRMSPGLQHARVFVSVFGSDEQISESLAVLNSASGFIRHQLSAVLRLKRTPALRFVYDESIRTAARIEELLKQEGDKAREQDY